MDRYGPKKQTNSKYPGGGNSKFSMNAVPPPAASTFHRHQPKSQQAAVGAVSKHGYSTMDAISQFASSSHYAVGKKRVVTEDEYFDDDEDCDLAYIPAPGSPSSKKGTKRTHSDSESEEDPLDAFMAGIEKQVEREVKTSSDQPETAKTSSKGHRADIDDMDDEESYYQYMESIENTIPLAEEGSDNEIEYDEDGNPVAPRKKKIIDPLPPIDHSEIVYQPFEKNFYAIHEDIKALSKDQVWHLRKTLDLKVTGPQSPFPVTSFAHFGFEETLMKAIRRAEYTQPTPIQSQAVPAILGGRDIIGIAKTGSGKTAAFIWPMLVHIQSQRELAEKDGPIALILAPTRELAIQIYNEAKKFGKVYNFQVVCCYGGGSKWEQSKALEKGAEICVATPGRMIDMVKMKATNLERVTYLVLDEADRMFNMGFEPQVRSICNHVRPDRQTLLFSATFKKRIEKLARDILVDPIRIVQGELGEANEDVTQHVILFANPAHKWNWLLLHLVEYMSNGSILIFVTKKADAEQVSNNLLLKEYENVLLHGDMDQADRNRVITKFKRKEVEIMVGTDVAARGLDIPHIKTVINYDIARDIDTHTHRIGRTGRAGEKGTAYTLISDKDKEFVGHLVRNLEGANQEVSEELLSLAMQSSWFRKSRFKTTGGSSKSVAVGGAGLGYRARTGPPGSSSVAPQAGGGGLKSFERSSSPPSSSSSSKAPATNRLSAMKETFKSQYNSQFRASSDKTWTETVPAQGVFTAPQLPPAPPSSSSDLYDTSGDKGKSKKSRWN